VKLVYFTQQLQFEPKKEKEIIEIELVYPHMKTVKLSENVLFLFFIIILISCSLNQSRNRRLLKLSHCKKNCKIE